MILETERLMLREMRRGDEAEISRVLCDEETMYAYEHAFSEEEVSAWLEKQLRRYEEDGFGLWLAVSKETGRAVGQCGLTMQDFDGRAVVEVGYLFEREHWHKGYATEAAQACRDYAFSELGCQEVFSIIRENNTASRRVAERNGMRECGRVVRHYYGMDMPHVVYSIRRDRKTAT